MLFLRDPRRRPQHPGALLRDRVLPELGLAPSEFARRLGIPPLAVEDLLEEKRRICPTLAARIGRVLHTGPSPWLQLQAAADTWEAEHADHGLQDVEPLLPVTQPTHDDWLAGLLKEAHGPVGADAHTPRGASPWHGTIGVASPEPVQLSPEARQHLADTLKAFRCPPPPEAFFQDVENAISLYRAFRKLAAKSLPGLVRKQLRDAHGAASELERRTAALSPLARMLLNEAVEGGPSAVSSLLCDVRTAIAAAQKLAGDSPSGRRPDDDRVYLARNVAEAIHVHLGIEPTLTRNADSSSGRSKGGVFIPIVEIVVEIATGTPHSAGHDLASRAVKTLKTEHGHGLVEYGPVSPRK